MGAFHFLQESSTFLVRLQVLTAEIGVSESSFLFLDVLIQHFGAAASMNLLNPVVLFIALHGAEKFKLS